MFRKPLCPLLHNYENPVCIEMFYSPRLLDSKEYPNCSNFVLRGGRLFENSSVNWPLAQICNARLTSSGYIGYCKKKPNFLLLKNLLFTELLTMQRNRHEKENMKTETFSRHR